MLGVIWALGMKLSSLEAQSGLFGSARSFLFCGTNFCIGASRSGLSMSFSKFGSLLPFSRIFRQVENDIETVVRVLQPGPLGIIEHKFSAEEIRNASATVEKAVANWRRAAMVEQQNDTLKEYIQS
ncbi:hypothetical protein QQ045_022111 [Rhodiola kirilowii]